MVVDDDLVRVLDHAHGQGTADYARLMARLYSVSDAGVQPIADGCAVSTGRQYPINRALELGMRGPIRAADLDAVEAFYRERGLRSEVELCAFTDRSLIELVNARGYQIDRFRSIYVRVPELLPPDPASAVRITVTDSSDALRAEACALVAAQGFAGHNGPLAADDINRVLATIGLQRPGAAGYTAWIDDQAAGAGAMAIMGDVAVLYSASTLPAFRRRGVQTALLRARIDAAARAGCAWITVMAEPESKSARNIQRAGFVQAYTRLIVWRALEGAEEAKKWAA
jgi:GNAT superfamily N-acetyltransferase